MTTLPPTDNDRAPSHRKPRLPPMADIAAQLTAGHPIEDIATQYERTPVTIGVRLNTAGYSTNGQPLTTRPTRHPVLRQPRVEPSWRAQANCAWTDPESFYPGTGESNRTAKRVCAACPVRVECLEEALANDEQYGVWGGTSPRGRRRIKQDREKAS